MSFSCSKEQPTVLSVSQTSLTSGKEGGTQTVVVSANKIWTASSDQGWCRISPSSGDGSKSMDTSVTITCEANRTSESRTCTISVKSEEKQVSIVVKQDEGDALLLSQTEYEVSSEAQIINLNVRYNVEYDIEVDAACKDWVSIAETKALSTQGYTITVAANDTYESRKGKVTFKQRGGNMSSTITIKQAQNDALMVEKTQYELSPEAQQLNIKVKSNVQYDVQIDAGSQSWISYIETKALTESTLCFSIALNDGDDRTGKVMLTASGISTEITISQRGEEYVVFGDKGFEAYCLRNYDMNFDNRISIGEALEIRTISYRPYFYSSEASLKGIEYFQNLEFLSVADCAFQTIDLSNNHSLKELSIPYDTSISTLKLNNELEYLTIVKSSCSNLNESISGCTALVYLKCSNNQLSTLDVSNNIALTRLECNNNQLTTLDISHNSALEYLDCSHNQLSTLDLDCPLLEYLNVYDNQLTSIDISSSPLCVVDRDKNPIKSLDYSNNTKLTFWNWYESERLENLNLSNCPNLASFTMIRGFIGTVNLTGCQSLTSIPLSSIRNVDSLIVSNCTSLKTVDMTWDSNIRYLDLSNCPVLDTVSLWSNDMEELNVSNCSSLVDLFVANPLKTLNIMGCSAISRLYCPSGQLTSLDVSQSTALTELYCANNQLNRIDVSKNPELRRLECGGNQITSLDVSSNMKLNTLNTKNSPSLSVIWLKTGQIINNFTYDNTTTIKYRD